MNELRPARPDDAEPIAAIMNAVWPDEPADPARIAAAISRPDRGTFVATSPRGGRVLAFIDAFMTYGSTGEARWEIDLLATHPRAQGQGLAIRMLTISTIIGRSWRARECRGLVRIGNVAGERTFSHCSYRTNGVELLLYTHQGPPPVLPPGMVAIPVNTFRYTGVWLEPASGDAAGDAPQDGIEVTGVLLPEDDAAARQWAGDAGFAEVGRYRWWVNRLGR